MYDKCRLQYAMTPVIRNTVCKYCGLQSLFRVKSMVTHCKYVANKEPLEHGIQRNKERHWQLDAILFLLYGSTPVFYHTWAHAHGCMRWSVFTVASLG